MHTKTSSEEILKYMLPAHHLLHSPSPTYPPPVPPPASPPITYLPTTCFTTHHPPASLPITHLYWHLLHNPSPTCPPPAPAPGYHLPPPASPPITHLPATCTATWPPPAATCLTTARPLVSLKYRRCRVLMDASSTLSCTSRPTPLALLHTTTCRGGGLETTPLVLLLNLT